MILMPEQRVQVLTGMVDQWIQEFEVTIDAGDNPMYAKSVAKGIYPYESWQQGVNELPDISGFWDAYEDAFPQTEPKGPDDVRVFITRLNERLPSSIRVIIVPENLDEYVLETEQGHKKVKALSVGAIAGHYNDAEEGHVEAELGGGSREVSVAKPIANATSIIFVSEKVLDNPARALIAIAHEGGHEEELHNRRTITDTSGNTHIDVSYHTEVFSSLSGIKAALHYAKWFGVDLNMVDQTAEQVVIFNQVAK